MSLPRVGRVGELEVERAELAEGLFDLARRERRVARPVVAVDNRRRHHGLDARRAVVAVVAEHDGRGHGAPRAGGGLLGPGTGRLSGLS